MCVPRPGRNVHTSVHRSTIGCVVSLWCEHVVQVRTIRPAVQISPPLFGGVLSPVEPEEVLSGNGFYVTPPRSNTPKNLPVGGTERRREEKGGRGGGALLHIRVCLVSIPISLLRPEPRAQVWKLRQ